MFSINIKDELAMRESGSPVTALLLPVEMLCRKRLALTSLLQPSSMFLSGKGWNNELFVCFCSILILNHGKEVKVQELYKEPSLTSISSS